jgi:hypothetical protein
MRVDGVTGDRAMTAAAVQALFTHADGKYFFARWGRPIVPVVFGVEDATLAVIKGAIEALVSVAGHRMAETDFELGANAMFFFVRQWDELAAVPQLEALVPGMAALCQRLEAKNANQYRVFHHDAAGAIRAVFVFLRMDTHLEMVDAEVLALAQAVQIVLLWADGAFGDQGVLGDLGGRVILRPEIAAVIRAAYDPVLPNAARDESHALRLAARVNRAMAAP